MLYLVEYLQRQDSDLSQAIQNNKHCIPMPIYFICELHLVADIPLQNGLVVHNYL